MGSPLVRSMRNQQSMDMSLFEGGNRLPFWIYVLAAGVLWVLVWGLGMEKMPVLESDFIVEDMPPLSLSDLHSPPRETYFTIERAS